MSQEKKLPGKSLIICEKPSVARTFSDVLGVRNNEKGYIENDEWIITWCIGHLVALSYPEKYDPDLKKWEMETLPFLPTTYKYEVIAAVKEQFYTVKRLLNAAERIYYAGDPAREGLYIQCLVRQMAGHNKNAEERVVWIDSQTSEEIKRGIREAKPLSAYEKLKDAGYMRAIEDYALGINFSRMLTLKYGDVVNNAAGSSKNIPLSVGRVMTCVLGMIVERERSIRDFKETTFYKIANDTLAPSGPAAGLWKVTPQSKFAGSSKLYNDAGFLKKEDAEAFIRTLSPLIRVENVEKTIEKKSPPFLFNLAELQYTCSKLYKISPDETLEIAQKLYEKKLTTYPRTDARVLSTAIAIEIDQNLKGLAQDKEFALWSKHILSNGLFGHIASSRYTDDSKITDHYAIIPTGANLDKLDECSDIMRAVYRLIVKRFLAIFLPPAEYTKVKVTEKAGNETFVATAKELTKNGYMELYSTEKESEEEVEEIPDNGKANKVGILLSMQKGTTLATNYSLLESKTSPPKRYSSGSLILAMENAGRLIDDPELRAQIKSSGIGTSATRDTIITKLVKLSYLKLNKKTQILTPGLMGELVYQVVHETMPSLLNPAMTASWEKGLSQIEDGTITADEYRKKLESYIRKEIENLRPDTRDGEVINALKPYAKVRNFENIQRAKRESNFDRGNSPKGTYAVKVATYIDVPFDDKDEAKELGAKFDSNAKSWYIPEGVDVEAFSKWKSISPSSLKVKKDSTKSRSASTGKSNTGKGKIYLKVEYADKDEVKRLGAKFDPAKKKWYITADNNRNVFARWLTN